MSSPARAAAWSIAAHGLAVGRSPGAVDPATWDHLVPLVREERLTGLLVAAVDDGTLVVTPAQRAQARDEHASAMGHALRLEDRLLAGIEVLTGAGIEHRSLKGPSFAHLDYPDPSWRPFRDVDMLVRSNDLDGAVAALTRTGWARRAPRLSPTFDRRFAKSVTMVDPSGLELDLHRTLADGPLGMRLDLDAIWRDPAGVQLGGVEVQALGAAGRCTHACLNAVMTGPRGCMLAWRDVAQTALGGLTATSIVREAAAWRMEAVVAAAVVEAWRVFGLGETELSVWARARETSRREARELALYRRSGVSYGRRALASLRAIHGARDKAALLYAVAMPRHAFPAAGPRPYLTWWWRGAKRAFGPPRRRGAR